MSKSAPKVKESPYEKQQAEVLRNLQANVAQPIQNVVMPQALQTLGGPGVFDTKLAPMDRQAIEGQFKQAQNSLMNSGIRGGQLRSQMGQNARDRAGAVAGATSQARNTGIERALGLVPTAFPSASTQMSGQNALASTDQNRLATNTKMQMQQDQQKGQSMGGLMGLFMGQGK